MLQIVYARVWSLWCGSEYVEACIYTWKHTQIRKSLF